MKKQYWDLVKQYKGIESDDIPERERTLIMKQLGIPHSTLYFYDTRGKHVVKSWKIADFYGNGEPNKYRTSLQVIVEDGLFDMKKRILAVYFASMQKQGFKRNTSEREGWKH